MDKSNEVKIGKQEIKQSINKKTFSFLALCHDMRQQCLEALGGLIF
jgi:hypothetical protein